jgi:hypothetical protein
MFTANHLAMFRETHLELVLERAWLARQIQINARRYNAAMYLINTACDESEIQSRPFIPLIADLARSSRVNLGPSRRQQRYVFKNVNCQRCGEVSHRGRCKRVAQEPRTAR